MNFRCSQHKISRGRKLPLNGNMVRTSLSAIELENVVCNNREPSIFERFNGDFETLSSISQLCPLHYYEGVPSSLSPGMGRHRMCSFGIKGEYGDNGTYATANNPNNLAALVTTEGKQDLQLPSFASGPQITVTMSGLQSLQQATSTTPSAECTGTGKPRMRARRGQATDPHSIAERVSFVIHIKFCFFMHYLFPRPEPLEFEVHLSKEFGWELNGLSIYIL
ncbi:unnamed protein product [Prunus brigantina]